jgi:hypothetical protein
VVSQPAVGKYLLFLQSPATDSKRHWKREKARLVLWYSMQWKRAQLLRYQHRHVVYFLDWLSYFYGLWEKPHHSYASYSK